MISENLKELGVLDRIDIFRQRANIDAISPDTMPDDAKDFFSDNEWPEVYLILKLIEKYEG